MAAGDLDVSFGTAGKAVVDFGQTSIVNAMAVQSDQSLVLAGRVGNPGTGDWALARRGSCQTEAWTPPSAPAAR
ncbi:hypothetical protein [Streptomyces lavendulae]|uniref:hypothetical protein n=1 Tax=Streptomyces lavendulae TaxID=1914 RepID=UPI00340C702B